MVSTIRKRLLTLALAVMLATGVVVAEDQAVTDWLRAHAIPLATVEAGHGFADLQPLKKVIGDARIVSLGEATHGSREIFQVKHRLLEFLASEMGFTIFSMEANMPEAYRLNDYVLRGEGDPAQLLRGLYFWTWDTDEVLNMIRWMREFNRSGQGHLEFTGFDMQTATIAADIVRRFLSTYEPGLAATATVPSPNAFGVAAGTFPITSAAGKRIRLTGYIKTDGVTKGWAGLWWRVDGPSGMLMLDNMQGRGASGTSEWKQYAIELPVAANATNINFGVILTGDGTAWFDDLAVTIDGEPYTVADDFDFGFESTSLKGLRGGGSGYTSTLDTQVARGGTQSLRLRHVASSPATYAAAWQEIVARLNKTRDEYRQHGASDHDIEWAVQNARIVLQSLEMQASSSPADRDRSMAENIKWIADQNPGAKIVLWAHNAHVGTGGGLGDQSMGTYLRKVFGPDMVVIGTAFNQGSFQAMPFPGQPGGLRVATVPPAPADSLDATLASTELPTFAIDLRQAPAWFKEPHRSREIGCCYPNDNPPDALLGPIRATEAFDAMVFIETVHSARSNRH